MGDKLPDDYFLIGDNAHTLTKTMLILFGGAAKEIPYERTCNYYLCQLRIPIEMAFGCLTTKWRIFRKKMGCDVTTAASICNAAAKLHDFIIENDNIKFPTAAETNHNFDVEEHPKAGEFNRG